MATYNHPGVYIEESLNPLVDRSGAPGEFSAAFVGVSKGGGPVGPVLVTSWTQYQALYGGTSGLADDLTYAVHAFFANGGGSAFIVRAVNDNATPATLSINGTQATPAPVLTVTASAPGTWASDPSSVSRVFVSVVPSPAASSTRFDLIVEVGTNTYRSAREQFTDLTLDPNDPRYAVSIVNSVVVGSKYITIDDVNEAGTTFDNTLNPKVTTKVPLTGGSEGTGTPDLEDAVLRLDSLDRNLVVNIPNADVAVVTAAVNWASTIGRHIIVADPPKPEPDETTAESVTALTTYADALPNSSHVAVYGPWVYQQDPGSRAGSLRLTAPGGAVVGQYLRTDASRGVFKAPAGIQTTLAGVQGPAHVYTNTQQDVLALAHVNLIKPVPGAGVCIMGARTQSMGYPDRYVSVRRLLISLKGNLAALSRFALFENNGPILWGTVDSVLEQFLLGQYEAGAFKGDSPDKAFFVRCDETNNSEADSDAGVLNIEVGVALQSPAEFIIIRLGQTQAATNVTDTLES